MWLNMFETISSNYCLNKADRGSFSNKNSVGVIAVFAIAAVETGCPALPSVHDFHPDHGLHLLDDSQAIACVELQGFKL